MNLPKAGHIYGESKVVFTSNYWTRTLYVTDEAFSFSYQLNFWDRSYGLPVRAVCPANGNLNGHEAVDLGLPSGNLWATCNVGAKTTGGVGDYFAWGETKSKDNYDWSTYKFMNDDTASYYYGITKYQLEDKYLRGCWYKTEYNGDNKTILEDIDDAAAVNWGGRWRMPSEEQIEELFKECYFAWTDDYNNTGIKGVIVFKAKSDADKRKVPELKSDDYTLLDNHIFLPLTGYYDDSTLVGDYYYGYYFGKSLYSSNGQYFSTSGSSGINFYYPRIMSGGGSRYHGNAIRPVWK